MLAIENAAFIALITGCNSGLGLATCQRMINEYLTLHPGSTIGIIVSTRSPAKSSDTIRQIYKYVASQNLPQSQIVLEHVEMDLTDLDGVAAIPAALEKLKVPRIDSLILNAGITGFTSLRWFRAVPMVIWDPVKATTFPDFNVSQVGVLLQAKSSPSEDKQTVKEHDLRLGQVFTANVFGHYILSHALSDLLHAGYPGGLEYRDTAETAGRILWISSVEAEAAADDFVVEDMQGIASPMPYHVSKRLIDLMVLTASLPEAKPYVDTFLSSSSSTKSTESKKVAVRQPTMHVTHPGIMATNIVPLHPILQAAMHLAFYYALLMGSPWHCISSYAGAVSVVWLSLVASSTLENSERGKARKWGSGRKLWETEVARWASVEGYDLGRKDRTVPTDPEGLALVRSRMMIDEKKEKKQAELFREQGIEIWKEMERLRVAWEKQKQTY